MSQSAFERALSDFVHDVLLMVRGDSFLVSSIARNAPGCKGDCTKNPPSGSEWGIFDAFEYAADAPRGGRRQFLGGVKEIVF